MKKTKLVTLAAMLLASSALVFTGCQSDADFDDTGDDTVLDQTGGNTGDTGNTGNTGDTGAVVNNGALEGNAADLAGYVYHRALTGANNAWGAADVGVTENSDGSYTLVSGSLWGTDGALLVGKPDFGELDMYDYIVFTVDSSNFVYTEAVEDLSQNKGVAVKVPEVIARPYAYESNGLTTFYAPVSVYAAAGTKTEVALLIGGKGTLTVKEFYLAAKEEPVVEEVTYKNETVYTAGDTLTTAHWGVDYNCEFANDGIVVTNTNGKYFGINTSAYLYKAGAKLRITYTADAEFNVKNVAIEKEFAVPAAEESSTYDVDFTDSKAGAMTVLGIVCKNATNIKITSIEIINE